MSPVALSSTLHEHLAPRVTVFHTLGYEQSTSEKFIRLLKHHRVAKMVDIRAAPVSRKPGFSKHQLQTLLSDVGIGYLHVQTLGAPKELRDALHSGGSWWSYVKAYTSRVLSKCDGEIEFLIDLATRERISLLCFERDPGECHRSLVARAIMEGGNGHNLQADHIRY